MRYALGCNSTSLPLSEYICSVFLLLLPSGVLAAEAYVPTWPSVQSSLCSTSCATEFVWGCMPLQSNNSGRDAFDFCMTQIHADDNFQLKSAGCHPACDATNEMIASAVMHVESNDDVVHWPRSVAISSGALVADAAGAHNSSSTGVIVMVGDSGCDARGPSEGETERVLANLLGTTVINNCVRGSTLTDVYNVQPACSSLPTCKWSIIMAGMTRDSVTGSSIKSMTDFILRERAASTNVVILGYPDPAAPSGTPNWHSMMNDYAQTAADNPGVWFIDSRVNAAFDGKDPTYYALDSSHPSAKTSREIFAPALAAIIANNTDANNDRSNGWSLYRFVPLKVRGVAGDKITTVRIAELSFKFRGNFVNMAGALASSASIGTTPPKAIDGMSLTHWEGYGMHALEIKFPVATPIDSYTFITAAGSLANDPVQWRLEASNDGGLNFEVIHQVLDDYATPTDRNTMLEWFRIPHCFRTTSPDRDQACISVPRLVSRGLAFPATP